MDLITTPAQLLTGLPVGTQTQIHCQWCDYEFYEGDIAIVLVSKPADIDYWTVHRAYCVGCDPATITGPTLGCTELLARCRLGTQTDVATQQTTLVVLEPELIDVSEPAESESVVETTDDANPQPTSDESVSVEIETLPPSLSVPASHRHLVTGAPVRSEEHPVPDGDAD